MNNDYPSRREFLQATAVGVAATAIAPGALSAAPLEFNDAGIPVRPLGKTGEKVSILGLGGFHSTTKPEAESLRIIRRAVDEGITFLDNAWDYHDGLAEERMGKALHEGKLRDKVFLMTKCCGRTAKDAQSNLEDSLRRLKTDHLDLWQFHEIIYDNDPDWIFRSRAGRLNSPSKPRSKARSDFLQGFTGHKDPSIHPEDAGKALRVVDRPDAP